MITQSTANRLMDEMAKAVCEDLVSEGKVNPDSITVSDVDWIQGIAREEFMNFCASAGITTIKAGE